MNVSLITYTPDPEKVIATAARICYSNKADIATISEGFTDEEIRKFIEQLISTGHACYDDQTEVLTAHGFKMWKDITEEDQLAVVDKQSAAFLRFEKPQVLHKYFVQDQNMLLLENDKYNFCVTDNHNLFLSFSYSQRQRTNPVFQVQQANEVRRYCTQKRGQLKPAWTFPMRMLRCACNRNETVTNKDCEYKLYGFFIGDGYCDSGNTLRFHLKLPRKIMFLTQVCQECGLQLDILANNKYVVRDEGIANKYREMFYTPSGEKTFPDNFFCMSYNQFKNFHEGLKQSDGWSYGNGYDTTSAILRDKIIALFSINGFAANYSTSFKAQEHTMWKDVYRIYYTSKFIMPHINDSREPDSYIRQIKYTGYVYCATVSTGLLIVRRKDRTLISGNSTLEHVAFTFGIEGISRIVSHELVRHRIGIAISQRSQRYCAEGECDFVVPDSILKASEGCGDEIAEVEDEFWASVCNDKQQYKDFMEVYDIPREDARYVLPGATMTRMIVTMNARELLHFFALRSCQRALPEMRQLTNEMIRLVKPVAPTLFKKAGPSCVQLGYCPEGPRCCGRAPTLKQLLDNWKKE